MKNKTRWTSSESCFYNVSYHFIWCPKYRRKILTGEIEKRLKEILTEKADSLGIEIAEMEIMPDHVHLFIKSSPVYAPHYIVAQLKGYSSRLLRKEFSLLRSKLPTLWTRSYYCESVGHISEVSVKKYIEDQKNK